MNLAYYAFAAHPAIIVLLIVLLLLFVPAWPYSRNWGYNPVILIILFVALLLLLGCQSTTNGPIVAGNAAASVRNFVNDIEPELKPASATACSLYLSFAVSPADQARVKSSLAKVASLVSAVNPSQAPGQLSKSIQGVLPSTQHDQQLADAIAGAYAIALPYIKGDPQLFLKVVSDIAAGVSQIASS